jgi:hypothetical protein
MMNKKVNLIKLIEYGEVIPIVSDFRGAKNNQYFQK